MKKNNEKNMVVNKEKDKDDKEFIWFAIISIIFMIIFWCWYMPVYHPAVIYYMMIA
jgi:hypothetical protein